MKFTMPIVKALVRLGIESEISGRNDITIDNKKFSGNAQYIRQGKVLHHGTLLFDSRMEELTKALKVSEDKFQSKGIKFYGSFFENENPEEIEDLLTRKRYEENEIRDALAHLNINDYFKGITLDELLSCIL